ncbi:MAG TPA: hypothetical protein VN676_00695 [Steroidobacteraceae bacterium]|nr:hypothetical protein [Steroidobacteraceae bacterium]
MGARAERLSAAHDLGYELYRETTYLSNALGQRVRKVTPSSIVNFAYDEAGHLIGEYDGTGNLILAESIRTFTSTTIR